MEEGDEYELHSTMIEELNVKCGLELSQEYSLYRPTVTSKPEDVTEDSLEKVVLMGGSHCARMVDQDETCLDVVDISVRGWRITDSSVEEKVRELTEIVSQSDEKRTTIVYQLFDNCSFFAKKDDGRRELSVRGADGKFHIDGKLEIATREDVKCMVSSAIPLLRAGG
jgi:hypothetical protein